MAKILLAVDDDVVHRSLICRIGEKVGFQSIGADSFHAAGSVLKETSVDCVTLDLTLGDRSGSEVMGLLSMFKCRCPIIVISGSDAQFVDDVVNLGKTLDLDIRVPMTKPIDLVALRSELTEISRQIDLSGAQARS
jgi:DNA-binding response OmpR family regulator